MRCKICGMSNRNTVHINKGQFGYHLFEDSLEGEFLPATSEILVRISDEDVDRIAQRVLEISREHQIKLAKFMLGIS